MEETSQSKAEPEIQIEATREDHAGISAPTSIAQREELDIPVLDDVRWEYTNARRCDLIRRKYAEGLTIAEQVELLELERLATSYLNTIAPLPAYPLDELQRHVDRIKAAAKNGS